jgi:hypothetical protein
LTDVKARGGRFEENARFFRDKLGKGLNSFEAVARYSRGHGGKDEYRKEEEHLYHTMGWSRELWIGSLGMPAVIPPPEEEKDVKTAIGAARAKAARKEIL